MRSPTGLVYHSAGQLEVLCMYRACETLALQPRKEKELPSSNVQLGK